MSFHLPYFYIHLYFELFCMCKIFGFGFLFFGLFFFNPHTLQSPNLGHLNQCTAPSNCGCFFEYHVKTLTHFLCYLLRVNFLFWNHLHLHHRVLSCWQISGCPLPPFGKGINLTMVSFLCSLISCKSPLPKRWDSHQCQTVDDCLFFLMLFQTGIRGHLLSFCLHGASPTQDSLFWECAGQDWHGDRSKQIF